MPGGRSAREPVRAVTSTTVINSAVLQTTPETPKKFRGFNEISVVFAYPGAQRGHGFHVDPRAPSRRGGTAPAHCGRRRGHGTLSHGRRHVPAAPRLPRRPDRRPAELRRRLPGGRRRSPPLKKPMATGAGRPRCTRGLAAPEPRRAPAAACPCPCPPGGRPAAALPLASPHLAAGRGACAPPPRGLPLRPGTAARPRPTTSLRRPRAAIAPGPAAPSRLLGRGPGRGAAPARRPSGVNSPGEAPRPAPAAAEPGPPLRPPAGRAAAPVAPWRCSSSSRSPSGGRRRPPPGRSHLRPPGPRRHVPGPALREPHCPRPRPQGRAPVGPRTPPAPRRQPRSGRPAPGPGLPPPEAGRPAVPRRAEGDPRLRSGRAASAVPPRALPSPIFRENSAPKSP